MQNVYLDHPITIQPSPVPQQLGILRILAIGPGPPCYAAVTKQGGPGPVARIRRKPCYEHDTDTRNNSRQCQWTPFTISSLFGTVRHNLTEASTEPAEKSNARL